MDTKVREFFRERYKITGEEALSEMEKLTEFVEMKRRDILMAQGEIPKKVFFQIDGIIRGFFVDEDGRDHTECFTWQYDLPAMPSGDLGSPSPLTMEALTECTLYAIPIEPLFGLLHHNEELMETYHRLMIESMELHYRIKRIFYQYDGKQRYEWFEKTFPNILEKVNLRYIASFLNMTPETLSRVRKELKREA